MKFATVRAFALALPGASEAPHHHYGSFRVNGKIFATVPPDQQSINVFIPEARREEVLALHSGFAEKLLWGGRVVGVRLQLAAADAATVKQLVREAWAHKSPGGKGA
ncbi:MmcQ/YjbR family DNA-binding protein [Pseudoduganella sp.]|uniref:MmcQ/YjbR family DNA-binding protein n=1 Tax=Pseudoduganella sp. TaxID=1880898 RepID=UPI0035AFED2B